MVTQFSVLLLDLCLIITCNRCSLFAQSIYELLLEQIRFEAFKLVLTYKHKSEKALLAQNLI